MENMLIDTMRKIIGQSSPGPNQASHPYGKLSQPPCSKADGLEGEYSVGDYYQELDVDVV